MEKLNYDEFLKNKAEGLYKQFAVYEGRLKQKGFHIKTETWWEKYPEGYFDEPETDEETEIEEAENSLEYDEEEFCFDCFPGSPSDGFMSIAIWHGKEDEDDGLTYFIPLCEGCGGEEENLELGDSEMVFLLKEAKAISEKGKWEYKKIKRAHMKEAFKELYALMEKPRKTLIITGIAVGIVVILAIILFAILGE